MPGISTPPKRCRASVRTSSLSARWCDSSMWPKSAPPGRSCGGTATSAWRQMCGRRCGDASRTSRTSPRQKDFFAHVGEADPHALARYRVGNEDHAAPAARVIDGSSMRPTKTPPCAMLVTSRSSSSPVSTGRAFHSRAAARLPWTHAGLPRLHLPRPAHAPAAGGHRAAHTRARRRRRSGDRRRSKPARAADSPPDEHVLLLARRKAADVAARVGRRRVRRDRDRRRLDVRARRRDPRQAVHARGGDPALAPDAGPDRDAALRAQRRSGSAAARRSAEAHAVAAASVSFAADVTDAEIEAYVASGEPLHVAGAFTSTAWADRSSSGSKATRPRSSGCRCRRCAASPASSASPGRICGTAPNRSDGHITARHRS